MVKPLVTLKNEEIKNKNELSELTSLLLLL